MKKKSVGLTALCVLVLFAAGDALAQKKGKKGKGKPVSVSLSSACETALELKFDDFKVQLPAKGKVGPIDIPPAKKASHRIHIGASTAEVYVHFKSGGAYSVHFLNCRTAGADFVTRDLSERPKKISPNAAAKVRFRAASRSKGPLPKFKYHVGNRGRLKRLSVGFTRPVTSPAGEFAYGLVLNAKRGRGILARVKNSIKVEAGHQYLIEASAEDGEIFTKVEDEGFDGGK